jgi:ribosomal protein S18 acetylase RimI-like enzyme
MEPSHITFRGDDHHLSATDFLGLVQQVWPGMYNAASIDAALQRTINITAWDSTGLIGCVRILTDGYLFGTITEILVVPHYQGRGIGRHLMDLAWERSPTSLFLGAQPEKEGFFEKLGFEPSLNAYHKRKPRPT